MARIIYSALVTSINGSVGGTTFQRNAYGHTIKKKPNIVNPNRPRQQARKANLQFLAQHWQNLTTVQRDAWASYAIAHPVPSRLNPSSNLSGHAIWLRTNLLRLTMGQTLLDTITNVNSDGLLGGTIEVQRIGGTLIYFDDSDSTLNNMDVLCYVSAPVKATQQYDRSLTRFMDFFSLSSVDQVDITSVYLAQFGALPTVGQFIFLRRIYLNRTNGQIIEYPATNFVIT